MSDKGQVEDGNGLGSQQATLREYAIRKGYNVLSVFSNDISGSTEEREGLDDLVDYLERRKKHRLGTIVLIDDLDRIARRIRAHFSIRARIFAAGGKLESPKRVYADDPEDDILQVVEAAFAGDDVTPAFHPAATRDRPVLSRMSAGEATGGVNPARCCSSSAANAAGV